MSRVILKDRGQRSEIRGQQSEIRSQKSEIRSQRSELARRQSSGVLFFYPIYLCDLCVSAVNLFFLFMLCILIPSIAPASEEDPLKDMDLNFLTEETFVKEKAKFFSISGYLESRNQLRVKDMDEPISLRQRLGQFNDNDMIYLRLRYSF